MDSVHIAGLGGTYGGNPIACAAALGAIETMKEEKLADRARHIGQILGDTLRALQSKYAVIGEVRGRGAMQAIELVKPGTKEPNSQAMQDVVKYCQSKGVLILTAGTYANVIRFLPPLVMSDELLKDALSVLEEAFESIS
jgi:4-aminobutyrate aminotransferase/(S)-3-amino-2-methylpropionate transaminase